MVMDSRDGYGHFHTFKPGDDYTSKASTSFGVFIVAWHVHEIRDGEILEAEGHVHDIRDIGPGDGWVYGDWNLYMKYRELAEEILNYLAVQDTQGNEIAEEESLYYIEEIIEDFMRKQEYFASE